MESLTETLKGWFWFAVKAIAIITLLTLAIFGPKDAAAFLGWVVGESRDAGDSGKIFFEEMKKYF